MGLRPHIVAERRTALVVGGSLGGLLAANLLHRAGWDVHVYERVARDLEGRGAGIVTHPELLEVVARAGVAVDESLGVRVQERVTLAQDGSVLARRSEPQLLTAWGRLYGLLREAFPANRYHNGKSLASFRQDEESVRVRFEDGEAAGVDLLVAADGMRSVVRHALMPEVKPAYVGYVAWRGLVEESVLSERTRAQLCPYFAFNLPPHEQMIGYPVAGRDNTRDARRRRFNFVWYRPADEGGALRDMVTDSQGKTWPEGIPPPLIRPNILAAARAAANEVLAPQFAEVVANTADLFFQPIFDLQSPRLAFGRVALMGDAAFVARPHCGMGVTKAGGDALALVEALQRNLGVAAGLKAYETARASFGQQVVAHAGALGAYMQAQLRTAHERRMAERYRSADAVMRETAVPFAAGQHETGARGYL